MGFTSFSKTFFGGTTKKFIGSVFLGRWIPTASRGPTTCLRATWRLPWEWCLGPPVAGKRQWANGQRSVFLWLSILCFSKAVEENRGPRQISVVSHAFLNEIMKYIELYSDKIKHKLLWKLYGKGLYCSEKIDDVFSHHRIIWFIYIYMYIFKSYALLALLHPHADRSTPLHQHRLCSTK